MGKNNRYVKIIEKIFFKFYKRGSRQVSFERDDLVSVAHELGIKLPKNLGDILYSFRYRATLPKSIMDNAPEGQEWVIKSMGRSRYAFVATTQTAQGLLARLRYNRLIDIFTGIACYSLQSHLRTTVPHIGQVETDELYVGLDKKGIHYVLPVQAKGGKDKLSIVQIEQDFALCEAKFPNLVCRPIAAQFMDDSSIALFEFEKGKTGIAITSEKHYLLVPSDEMTPEDLEDYRKRLS